MKNLFVYYLVAMIIPLPVLYWVFKTQTGYLPIVLFFIYLFVYRTILDSYRLIQKGVIRKNEAWKMVFGFGHIRWFKELYLER